MYYRVAERPNDRQDRMNLEVDDKPAINRN